MYRLAVPAYWLTIQKTLDPDRLHVAAIDAGNVARNQTLSLAGERASPPAKAISGGT